MKYNLQDLIDIKHFQNLQDWLNKIYPFPSSIIDNDGNILTATAWQDVCTRFHRANKDSEKECVKSDQYILDHLHEANPAVSYRCPHGLVDNAIPIIIDGIHYGNFFTGQFFLEEPDLDFFKAQAGKYGFDEDAYIEAVKKVPVWTQEQVDNYILFISGLISVISESALKRLEEIKNRELIKAGENRHRSILKSAMDGYWLTDTEGRLLEVNDSYCKMSGYSKDELLSMGIHDLEAVETPQLTAKHIKKVITQGYERFKSRHRRRDGSVFDIEASIQFRPEDGGQFVCFLRDITDYSRMEDERRNAEERYKNLLNSLNAGVIVHAPDTSILMANPAACKLLGLSQDEILGKEAVDSGWRFLREDGSDMPLEEYPVNRVISSGKPLHNIVFGVKHSRSGDLVWLLVNGFAVFQDTGQIEQAVINFVDITERVKAEAALKESEERFKALHNASFGGIAIHDKGIILECNRGLSILTGYEYNELIGMNGLELISDDTRDQVIKNINAGYEKPYEAKGIRKNGESYPLRLEARNIPYKGKNVRVVEFRDITENKKAEEDKEKLENQLQQAQKMEAVGRLAGGVAHDFNNMLGVIIGHADMIMEDIDPDHPFYTDIEEIIKAGNRSVDLTRQLLAFARKQTVAPIILDLNRTVSGMIKMLHRLIGEDINLTWIPGKNTGKVKMDPSQIDQILANLCVNARDAISGVGKITIETGTAVFDKSYCAAHAGFIEGEYVLIAVSDNGCGMDSFTRQNVFEPFFTTKEQGKGTGLGLSTVYGVVKQNNGFVNVYSEPGHGTTFRMYLPKYMDKAASLSKQSHRLQVERGHETILLVEDEPAILKITTMMLQRMGYKVIPASGPDEAVNLAREYAGQIHLLLTDVIMPDMNGRDLAGIILSLYPNLKRLFMSGYTANVIAHHGVLDAGINFIQKPFSKEALSEKVREALDYD